MSLKELNLEEIEQVSGAGTLLGDSIINAVNAGNQFLNTPLISSVGVVFSAVGLGLVHQLADTTGYVASKVGIAVGQALGEMLQKLKTIMKKRTQKVYIHFFRQF
nr:hypothetical protein [Acinetobacter seifertii]